jgi:hypothetical protein
VTAAQGAGGGRPAAAAGLVHNRREELAWAAGIFDGEGYIASVARKVPSSGRRVPRLEMRVSQYHDDEVINRFAAALGGGRVYHRVIRRSGATEWAWAAYSLEAAYHGRRAVIGVRAWRRRGGDWP